MASCPRWRSIPRSEVADHCSADSLWMVLHDDVLDVTPFLGVHPGGEDILLEYAGADATEAFEAVGHSGAARALIAKYKIGELPANERRCAPHQHNITLYKQVSCPAVL